MTKYCTDCKHFKAASCWGEGSSGSFHYGKCYAPENIDDNSGLTLVGGHDLPGPGSRRELFQYKDERAEASRDNKRGCGKRARWFKPIEPAAAARTEAIANFIVSIKMQPSGDE